MKTETDDYQIATHRLLFYHNGWTKKITSQAFAKRLTANDIPIVKTRIEGIQCMGIKCYRFNTEFIDISNSKEGCQVEEEPEGKLGDKYINY